MAKKPEDLDPQEELRRRALAVPETHLVDPSTLSADQLRGLVQELRVHQIELEMQNQELRETQAKLRAAHDRYADLYDFAPVGYLTLDDQDVLGEANLAVASLLGVERGKLIGERFTRFVAREDQDRFYVHRRQMRGGEGQGTCELRLKREGAGVFWAQMHCQRVTGRSDFGAYRYALSDVSERRQLELERVRTQRLRAVGELAAGISHNLNNLLTGILLSGEILQSTVGDPELLLDVDTLVLSTRRAADLIQRLHRSVRHVEDGGLQAVRLDGVVRHALLAARPRWKDEAESAGIGIEVITRLESVPPVRGTASELHDLLVNLLLNAVDALPRGGTITIAARQVGDAVRLGFRDTGVGMDEEIRSRVFEPFFTTKSDVGSGLGLFTAYNTVRRWGGKMDVDSAPGRGTTFTVELPVTEESAGEEDVTAEPTSSGRRGRLLVVDDHEFVVHALSSFLPEWHDVEFATDGREALDRFAPDSYDVALVDLGLPGLPGDQVARRMRHEDPLLGLVLMTGWQLEESDDRLSPFDFLLQKPFGPADVQQVVAQAVALHDERSRRRRGESGAERSDRSGDASRLPGFW